MSNEKNAESESERVVQKNDRRHYLNIRTASATRGASSLVALATGAVALGVLAIGAIAVGRLMIGKFFVKEMRIGSLVVDDLIVKRLKVLERD